ncbi:hypothetical protein HanHA89_Chr02g0067791 [Helianthus annuus]|nr:hypothetical protein HanHA89_Chr02g0067791 [Helianthus annuus]
MGGRATVVAWRGGDGNHIKSGRHKRTRERRRGGGGGGGNDGRRWSSTADVMSEMMETAATVGFHRGSAAVHGGGSLFVSDGSYDDVVLDRFRPR